MTPEKLIEAFRNLDAIILKHQAVYEAEADPPSRLPSSAMSHDNTDKSKAHLRWMCQKGIEYAIDAIEAKKHHYTEHARSRTEKAMRWLGFVQGACWAWFDITIGDLKAINKPESEISSSVG